MKTKKQIIVIIAALGLTLSSCYWHNWDTVHPNSSAATAPCMVVDTSTHISYSVDIAPIIASKCAVTGCHSAGGNGSANDYTFYGSAGSHGSGIASVCAGGLTGSSAWADITGTSGNPMPKSGSPQLTSCETLIIRNWILHGASNN
ncbi:MAG TPA: hypothetical protein VN698_07950 [Bacteroidia bacterium]|nr:hypothetical protein [Bacteroidia bacterium]